MSGAKGRCEGRGWKRLGCTGAMSHDPGAFSKAAPTPHLGRLVLLVHPKDH